MILYQEKSRHSYTIGGKAAGLRRLQALGYAVPDFLLFPAENFDPLLQELKEQAAGPEEIRKALQAYSLADKDKAAIIDILKQ